MLVICNNVLTAVVKQKIKAHGVLLVLYSYFSCICSYRGLRPRYPHWNIYLVSNYRASCIVYSLCLLGTLLWISLCRLGLCQTCVSRSTTTAVHLHAVDARASVSTGVAKAIVGNHSTILCRVLPACNQYVITLIVVCKRSLNSLQPTKVSPGKIQGKGLSHVTTETYSCHSFNFCNRRQRISQTLSLAISSNYKQDGLRFIFQQFWSILTSPKRNETTDNSE